MGVLNVGSGVYSRRVAFGVHFDVALYIGVWSSFACGSLEFLVSWEFLLRVF